MSRRREIGHALASVLGIQLEEPEFDNPVTRGESVFSNHTADGFVEQQPSSAEWLDELLPSARDVADYVKSLFPFLSWIGFYNLQWLLGDLVAGRKAPSLDMTCYICTNLLLRCHRGRRRHPAGYGVC